MFTVYHFSPSDTQVAPAERPMETVEMLADWLPTIREEAALVVANLSRGNTQIMYGDPGSGKATVRVFVGVNVAKRTLESEDEAEAYFIEQVRRLS